MYCYRAPSKVILVGEHFVVRGTPGLSAAIGLWSYACAERYEGPGFIEAPDLGVACRIGECSGVDGLEAIVREVGGGVRLRVWSEAPMGAGLGSSASVSVAAAAAVLRAARGEFSLEEVERLAWIAERVHHGKPSGIDHTTALYGGVLRFESRGIFGRIPLEARLILVIADTGVKRETRRAVQAVLSRFESHRAPMTLVYNAAALLVEEATRALIEGDVPRLGEIMDMMHGLLYSLGVSSPQIERLVWAARRAGALGAKLTGAGIGGVIVALVDSKRNGEEVAAALTAEGARWARIVEAGVNGLTEMSVNTWAE